MKGTSKRRVGQRRAQKIENTAVQIATELHLVTGALGKDNCRGGEVPGISTIMYFCPQYMCHPLLRLNTIFIMFAFRECGDSKTWLLLSEGNLTREKEHSQTDPTHGKL